MVGRTQVAQWKMYHMGSGPMANAYFMFERLRKFVYSSISFVACSTKASNPVSWATRQKTHSDSQVVPQILTINISFSGNWWRFSRCHVTAIKVKKVYHTIMLSILCMTQPMATPWTPHTNATSQMTLTVSTKVWSFKRRSHMAFSWIADAPQWPSWGLAPWAKAWTGS